MQKQRASTPITGKPASNDRKATAHVRVLHPDVRVYTGVPRSADSRVVKILRMLRFGEKEPAFRHEARVLHETRGGQQAERDVDRMQACAQPHQQDRYGKRGDKETPLDAP